MQTLETLHPFLTAKLQAAWPTALVFEVRGVVGRFVVRRPGHDDFVLVPDYMAGTWASSGAAFWAAKKSIACIVAAEKAAKKPSEEPARADK